MKHTIFLIFSISIFSLGNVFSQEVSLKVRVVVPKNTPKDDTLRIVGNQKELGDWFSKNGVRMTKESDSTWYYQTGFPKGTHIQFKITRGSYMSEALYDGIEFPPAFSLDLVKDTLINIRPRFWNDIINNSATGNMRYHHNYSDPKLRFTRDVFVWLPPSYEKKPGKHYPVLYMHDGQNLFDGSLSGFVGAEWRMDEVTDSLIKTRSVEEIIIVGISNTKDRWAEYSGLPKGRDYADFVVNNLKPFIDKNYRTKPDRENTAVMGSSMGGLISFYFVLWHPEVFSKAAMLSGGFVYDEAKIIDRINTIKLPEQSIKLYFDCGDKELDNYFLPANKIMFDVLNQRGVKQIEFVTEYGAKHNENEWAKRIWKPLVYMFGNKDNSK